MVRAFMWVQICAQSLWVPLLLRFNFVFPDNRPPAWRGHRYWPWLFALLAPIFLWAQVSGNWTVGQPMYMGTIALALSANLGIVSWKYRRADTVARRQFRWILLGAWIAGLPIAITTLLLSIDSRFEPVWFLSSWLLSALPIAILVSVVRFNLFDVDRLLSATASYNVLLVLVGAGILMLVPRLAEAVSGVSGIDPGISQVVLSLALAAVVVPAHRRLRPQIDRVFFKERYAVDHGVAELLPSLSACRDAQELTERAGTGLHQLLRPEACVVYAAAEQGYAPVFVEGRAVPPAFGADSPLIGTLRGRRRPLSLSDTAAAGPTSATMTRPATSAAAAAVAADRAAAGPAIRSCLKLTWTTSRGTRGPSILPGIRRRRAGSGCCSGPFRVHLGLLRRDQSTQVIRSRSKCSRSTRPTPASSRASIRACRSRTSVRSRPRNQRP